MQDAFAEAAAKVVAAVDPADDVHASSAYRRHLAGVMAARALWKRRWRAREDIELAREQQISVTVNGRVYEKTVPVRLSLADFIREHLHLTGTHLGCEHGVCGACTISLERPQRALVPDAGGAGRRRGDRHHRRSARRGRHAPSDAAAFPRELRLAVRLLHAGHADHRDRAAARTIPIRPSTKCAKRCRATSAAAAAIRRSSTPC